MLLPSVEGMRQRAPGKQALYSRGGRQSKCSVIRWRIIIYEATAKRLFGLRAEVLIVLKQLTLVQSEHLAASLLCDLVGHQGSIEGFVQLSIK